MVNLRYHVVTLVAVFLALAMGVVLGAGPLQGQISAANKGTNLTDQTASLQQELDVVSASNSQQSIFIDALASKVLQGTLTGRLVAVVSLPDVDPQEAELLTKMIADAGGQMVGNVQLTESWISPTQREYRDSLSRPLSSHLTNPETGGTADDILSVALAEILTSNGSDQDLIRDILTDEQTPLVSLESLPTELADSIILLGPGSLTDIGPAESGQSDSAENGQTPQTFIALAKAFAEAPQGAVALGVAEVDGDLIQVLRAANSLIPTVDQAGTSMGAMNAVLALAAKENGAFGQQLDSTKPVASLPVK